MRLPTLRRRSERRSRSLSLNRLAIVASIFAVFSCSSDVKYDRQESLNRVYEGNNNLYIQNPSLSPDGRTLLFDFYERISQDERSRYAIGLYEIDTRKIRIIRPKDPRMEWYSPSFSGSGDRFAMIEICLHETCRRELSHPNIAEFNIVSNNSRILTSYGKQEHMWTKPFASSPLQLVPVELNRTSPIYSRDNSEIYYLGSRFWPGDITKERDFTLRKVKIRSKEDRIILNEKSGAAYFLGDGSIALADNANLMIFGGVGKGGLSESQFRRAATFAYKYDLRRNAVSGVLAANDLPDPDFRHSVVIDSLTASRDGRRAAYIAGRGQGNVVLLERGKQEIIATKREFKIQSLGDLAMSGDGTRLVVIGDARHSPGDLGYFWLIDLETSARQRFQLSELLRETLNRSKGRKQKVTRYGF